jgi:hypothetical protein
MPYIPGQWFPKKNDGGGPPLFEVSMLALLKPWDLIGSVKMVGKMFPQAYNDFAASSSNEVKTIIKNIQFYHECLEGARAKQMETEAPDMVCSAGGELEETDVPVIDSDVDGGGDSQFESLVTEEQVQKLLDRPFSGCEQLYTEEAIDIGIQTGTLACPNFETVYRKPPMPATLQQLDQSTVWDKAMRKPEDGEIENVSVTVPTTQEGDMMDICATPQPSSPSVCELPKPKLTECDSPVTKLNEEQVITYEIVISHLKAFLRGKNPPQQLVVVHGQGVWASLRC